MHACSHKRKRLRRNKAELDRIERTLFLLPFIVFVDLIATLFSLSFGSREVGILAKPIHEQYHEPGLVAFSCLLFLAFLTGVWFLGYLKREFAREKKLPVRVVWTIGVYAVFFVEAFWMGLAIQNFFVPFLLPLGLVVIWTLVSLTYFVSVSFFTRIEMRQFLRS